MTAGQGSGVGGWWRLGFQCPRAAQAERHGGVWGGGGLECGQWFHVGIGIGNRNVGIDISIDCCDQKILCTPKYTS
jgi:hypothetical protein